MTANPNIHVVVELAPGKENNLLDERRFGASSDKSPAASHTGASGASEGSPAPSRQGACAVEDRDSNLPHILTVEVGDNVNAGSKRPPPNSDPSQMLPTSKRARQADDQATESPIYKEGNASTTTSSLRGSGVSVAFSQPFQGMFADLPFRSKRYNSQPSFRRIFIILWPRPVGGNAHSRNFHPSTRCTRCRT